MVLVLILLTIAVLISIDVLVFNRKKNPATANLDGSSSFQVFNLKDTELPLDYYYSKSHTWVKKLDENNAAIGLDGFLFNALGKIKAINISGVGRKIKKGDVLFESSINGHNLKFKSPVSGILQKINDSFLENHVNDPAEWFFQIKPENFSEEVSSLMPAMKAHKWVKTEFKRLKDLLFNSVQANQLAGATMYDGGNIAEGAVSYLDVNCVKDFEELFMKI